jgi:hypothetical protein
MPPEALARPFCRLLLTLAALSASATALAEPVGTPEYVVEIVIFEHTDPAATRAELWPQVDPLVGHEGAVELRGAPQDGFAALGGEALQLKDLVERLREASAYRVLLHRAWRQPGLPEDASRPVLIRAGENLGARHPELMLPSYVFDETGNLVEIPAPTRLDELTGTVRVALGRFLHVYSDLVLRRIEPLWDTPTPAPSPAVGGDTPATDRPATGAAPLVRLQEIPVQEYRRMRSRELHHLDHPLLGMLVQITPLPPPGKAEAAQP